MPLHRRLPKRGFTNIFRQEWVAINLSRLIDLPNGTQVSPGFLRDKGWAPARELPVKILAMGDLKHPLTIQAHKFSAAARAKIEAAGGTAEVLPLKLRGPKPKPLSPRALARINARKGGAAAAETEPLKETPA